MCLQNGLFIIVRNADTKQNESFLITVFLKVLKSSKIFNATTILFMVDQKQENIEANFANKHIEAIKNNKQQSSSSCVESCTRERNNNDDPDHLETNRNKTPTMHRYIFRLQLANYRRLIKNLPPPW